MELAYFRPGRPARRNLVLVAAGDGALHPGWDRTMERGERNWDLAVTYYGDQPAWPRRDEEIVVRNKGMKYEAIRRLYREFEFLRHYERIWLPDDDIQTRWQDVNDLFDLAQAFDLALAQPALTADSFAGHAITLADDRFLLRYVDFVECMVPVFSQAALAQCLDSFHDSGSCWGLDVVWAHMLGLPPHRMAIIDAVQVRHTRPVGGGDAYELIDGKPPMAELTRMLGRHGEPGIPPPRMLGGILRQPVAVTGAPGDRTPPS